VALSFAGTAKFEEIDNVAHKARLKAQGSDQKGRGNASAMVSFSLQAVPNGTKVNVDTDLTLTGAVAQYGRGAGMLQDVAQQLIGQFARALQDMLNAQQPVAAASNDATSAVAVETQAAAPRSYAPKPIGGFSLILRVLWNSLVRVFKRS
jgi:phage I-like protein